jgi:putative membrane protein
MRKAIVYGTAVLSLAAVPLMAQQPSSTGSTQSTRPGTPATGTPATSTPSAQTSQASKATNPDHAFVMEAAMGGMAEVELGQLAKDKAQSEPVKTFADRMVTDHGKANDELKTLAQQKNITLPTDSGAKHKATKDRLSKLSGAAFDKAYMQEMLTDHRKDVSEFQKESRTGKDPDVKAWAAKALPTLEEHLQMAQTASRSAVGTSGTKTGTENGKGASGTDATTPRAGGQPSPGGTTTTPSGGSTSSPGTATGSSSPR